VYGLSCSCWKCLLIMCVFWTAVCTVMGGFADYFSVSISVMVPLRGVGIWVVLNQIN
jgi:hypothetical protein